MKTGFWKALIGSCSGTAVFAALRGQKLWRAIWHLILMTVLCTILMSIGWNARLRPAVMRAVDIFCEHCGGVQMDAAGITPLTNPEKTRSFLVPGPWSVTYLPLTSAAPDPLVKEDALTQGAEQGVIWAARHIVLWRKVSGGYDANAVSRNQAGLGHTRHFGSAAELLAGVRQLPETGFDFQLSEPLVLTPGLLREEAKIVLPIGIGTVIFQQTISEVVLYLLMFAAVFSLMNIGKKPRVRFKELLVLEIYAGFPAMLIGSAAVALDLPVLEFHLVYVLGMTLYLIWILNRLNEAEEKGADVPKKEGKQP